MIWAFTATHYNVCASGIRYVASIDNMKKQSSIDNKTCLSTVEWHRPWSIDTPRKVSIDIIQLTNKLRLSIDKHDIFLNLGMDETIELSIDKCVVNYIRANWEIEFNTFLFGLFASFQFSDQSQLPNQDDACDEVRRGVCERN